MPSKSISVPMKVISEANSRDFWAKSHMRKKAQKGVIGLLLPSYGIEKRFPVEITMIRKGKKLLDDDNLQSAFKYIRDAIADYFIPNLRPGMADSRPGFTWKYDQEISDHYGFTVIFQWAEGNSEFEREDHLFSVN